MTDQLSQDYTWRPLRFTDLPALYTLLLTVSAADDRVDTLADLQSNFADPLCDPATDSLAAWTPDGMLAAYGRCYLHPEPQREQTVWLEYEFHPDHARPRLEDDLIGWLEARGRARLLAAPTDLPRSLRTSVADDKLHEIAMLTRRGFAPIRYFVRMRRDLHLPIIERLLPVELRLQPYTPHYREMMRVVLNEAFRDHWGHEDVLPAEWENAFVGSETFRPDFSFLTMAGDEAVGLIFCMMNPADNNRSGRAECNIRDVAVLRPWRKRGVASALISASMSHMRFAGLDYATLGVDMDNPTGALGVYEKLGFVPVRRFISYAKPVA
jgi:ribosomal protein S18 acetylase RimI-like enzyme